MQGFLPRASAFMKKLLYVYDTVKGLIQILHLPDDSPPYCHTESKVPSQLRMFFSFQYENSAAKLTFCYFETSFIPRNYLCIILPINTNIWYITLNA